MLSCAQDVKGNSYVGVTDIPGALLQADMEDNVHSLWEGTIVEMITELGPTIYRKHIWYNRSKTNVIFTTIKPLYGTLQAALLFWKAYQIHYRSGDSNSTHMTKV